MEQAEMMGKQDNQRLLQVKNSIYIHVCVCTHTYTQKSYIDFVGGQGLKTQI